MIQKLLQLMPKDWLVIKERGFSLVEVILAGSIFVMATTVFIGTIIYGQESTVLSGKRVQAMNLAEEGLEAVRNIRDADFANLIDGTYGLQIIAGAWNIAGSSDTMGNFTREINISSIDANTKKITATVTWQQNLQRQGSVSIDTYLTYWTALATNQGDGLVVDTSNSNVGALDNTQVVGLTLENSGASDITIDQITVSWSNALGGTKISDISIDNSLVWTGNSNSGDVLTITSFTLPPGAAIYPIDYLGFSKDMTGTTITLDFTMSDGSIVRVTFSPGVSTDVIAPVAVTDLNSSNPTSNSIDLTWTAPGDDGSTGTATSYDIRYSTSLISEANWATALQLSGEPTPQVAGSSESVTVSSLSASTLYYFAIKSTDEVANTSIISNISSATTLVQPTDVIAPTAVIDLTASSPTSNSVNLTWTAPGDDGNTGTATSYDIRYATSLITETNWSAAIQATGEPTPQVAGSSESMTVSGLSAGTTYYFAVKTSDEVPNTSTISNVPNATTLSQSDSLNVNISSVNIDPTNNKRIIGITIYNTGASNIVLDQMTVAWTGVSGGAKLNSITINSDLVWSGNNSSGATSDITNFTLSPATTYPITYLTFSKDMTGAIMSINFIMADGSTKLISNITP